MPISSNFTSILTKDWDINFLQCYPNGCMKYTELCNILQLTAAAHSELGGISFSDMQEYNQAWVLSKMRLELKRLPKWKEIVTVKTWINSLENSRSTRCLEVYSGKEKLIGCETFWAVFNTEKRRPEPLLLPHEHFEKYEHQRATEQPFARINIQGLEDVVAEHVIMLSDLDIVNHVNNVKYLEWCLDLLDSETILSQQIKAFELNFMKELSLLDVIQIVRKKNTFAILKEGKACFALELEG